MRDVLREDRIDTRLLEDIQGQKGRCRYAKCSSCYRISERAAQQQLEYRRDIATVYSKISHSFRHKMRIARKAKEQLRRNARKDQKTYIRTRARRAQARMKVLMKFDSRNA